MDLIKNIAKPPIEGYRVSYAELIMYLIKILPAQQVDVLPSISRDVPFEDTTTESLFENKQSDSTYEDTTTESSFETVEDETEFEKDG